MANDIRNFSALIVYGIVAALWVLGAVAVYRGWRKR